MMMKFKKLYEFNQQELLFQHQEYYYINTIVSKSIRYLYMYTVVRTVCVSKKTNKSCSAIIILDLFVVLFNCMKIYFIIIYAVKCIINNNYNKFGTVNINNLIILFV